MYKSFFIYGASGSGKTTLASTAHKPILFLDFDAKVERMTNLKKLVDSGEIVVWKPQSRFDSGTLLKKVMNKRTASLEMPQGYVEFSQKVTELEEECKYRTVVLDSLTMVNEHLKRLIMYLNKLPQMSRACWDSLLTSYMDLFESFRNIQAHTIVIAHDKIEKNELTGTIEYRPAIDGSMKDRFSSFFEEVYYCKVVVDNDKPSWKVLTIQDDEHIARTCLPLEMWEEPNLTKILEKGGVTDEDTNSKI